MKRFCARGDRVERVVADVRGLARLARCLIQYWWNGDQAEIAWPIGAEAVDVAIADAAPVDELDAELEAALRLADEIVLVDAAACC